MSAQQKLLAAVLGGLVLALLVVLGGVAYVRGGGSTKLTAAEAPNNTSTIPTLDNDAGNNGDEDLDATTTTSSTTTTSTTTTIPGNVADTSTSAPPASRLGPVVTGSGAILSTGSGTVRDLPPGAACQGLAEPNATDVRCETFRARGGDLVWLTQSTPEGLLGSARTRRVSVLARRGATQWATVLERSDTGGSSFRAVNVRVVDVSGDGAQDAVFGFRLAGSDALAVDVVEGPGTVTVHRDAPGGSARVSAGQLDVWSDAGSAFTHEVIRSVQGAYRVVSSEQVAKGDVPPSQL